jgi:signal transduction histidine kinase
MTQPRPRIKDQTIARIAGVSALALILAVFGFAAVRQWRSNAQLLAERRAVDRADFVGAALARDMRGAQSTVLSQPQFTTWGMEPDELTVLIAGAFARYPYPESFFATDRPADPNAMQFFNRADRSAAWDMPREGGARFPVVPAENVAVARELLDRIWADAGRSRRYSVFNLTLGNVPYQVVARLVYHDSYRSELASVFGFTTNLSWARTHYFRELTEQISRIGDSTGFGVAVLDSRGEAITGSKEAAARSPMSQHPFPLLFADPLVVPSELASEVTRETLTITVSAADDPSLRAANIGATATLLVTASAAVVLIAGVALTLTAANARSRLADVRAEFTASVTHELKTPIATIRVIGDTLASGRLTAQDGIREYGQLVTQESKRLAHLVENVLAFSRIADVTEVYSFDRVPLIDVVNDALREVRAHLEAKQFDVVVDLPVELPAVRADRMALRLVLDNVLDNAIRYSADARRIVIRGSANDGVVAISVADAGIGIPTDEIAHVTRRFFRGRKATSGGSGLGLAIVSRIVADHGGTIDISSEPDLGTTVVINLPEERTCE